MNQNLGEMRYEKYLSLLAMQKRDSGLYLGLEHLGLEDF